MKELFSPKSVVVIGVSPRPSNLAKNIVMNLEKYNFQGKVHLIGAKSEKLNQHQINTSIQEIDDTPDLAVFLIPAQKIPFYLEECGKKGIKYAIIESAGFSEYGSERKDLENEILSIANQYGIRFIGPNCLGIINASSNLNVLFSFMMDVPKNGTINLLCQSGGVGLVYFGALTQENLPVAKFINLGNKLNIDESHVLSHLKDDSGKLTCLYLEDIRQGRKFFEITKNYPTPILIQKANINTAGMKAASSHTSALSGDDRIVDALFRQNNIVRVSDMNSMVESTKVFSLPPMRGNNLAIVSRSGGHAVIAADYSEVYSFNLPEFPKGFMDEAVKHFRGKVIRPSNPLDLGDLFDFDIYIKIVEKIIAQDWIDGIVFIHVYDAIKESAAADIFLPRLCALSKKYQKPIVPCLFSHEKELQRLKQIHKLPYFTSVAGSIRSLKISRDYYNKKQQKYTPTPTFKFDHQKIGKLLKNATASKQGILEVDAMNILEAAGFPLAPRKIVNKEAEIETAVKKVGTPLVMKVISKDIMHKSDVGGVRLNIENSKQALTEFRKIKKQVKNATGSFSGVLLQKQVQCNKEIFLGAKRDPNYGPIVMVGIGGIYVEALHDISTRLAPVSMEDVDEMLSEVKSFKILQGLRGEKKSDINFLKECIYRLSQLIVNFPQIADLDINPLMIFPEKKKGLIVDAKINLPFHEEEVN